MKVSKNEINHLNAKTNVLISALYHDIHTAIRLLEEFGDLD